MGQQITRAKAKSRRLASPYRVPSAEDLPARVSGVLAVLYLVFNARATWRPARTPTPFATT